MGSIGIIICIALSWVFIYLVVFLWCLCYDMDYDRNCFDQRPWTPSPLPPVAYNNRSQDVNIELVQTNTPNEHQENLPTSVDRQYSTGTCAEQDGNMVVSPHQPASNVFV